MGWLKQGTPKNKLAKNAEIRETKVATEAHKGQLHTGDHLRRGGSSGGGESAGAEPFPTGFIRGQVPAKLGASCGEFRALGRHRSFQKSWDPDKGRGDERWRQGEGLGEDMVEMHRLQFTKGDACGGGGLGSRKEGMQGPWTERGYGGSREPGRTLGGGDSTGRRGKGESPGLLKKKKTGCF